MKKMQKDVDQWVSQYTPAYWQPHEILARLIEEVGELAREINHQYGQKRKRVRSIPRKLRMKLAI